MRILATLTKGIACSAVLALALGACNGDDDPPPKDVDAAPEVDSAPASCEDTEKNQDETDVDCGGETCDGCEDGKACLVAKDCLGGICGDDMKCTRAEAQIFFGIVTDTTAYIPALQDPSTAGPDFISGGVIIVDFDSHDPTVASPLPTGCKMGKYLKENKPANTNIDAKATVTLSGINPDNYPACTYQALSPDKDYACLVSGGLAPTASVSYSFEKLNPACVDGEGGECDRAPVAHLTIPENSVSLKNGAESGWYAGMSALMPFSSVALSAETSLDNNSFWLLNACQAGEGCLPGAANDTLRGLNPFAIGYFKTCVAGAMGAGMTAAQAAGHCMYNEGGTGLKNLFDVVPEADLGTAPAFAIAAGQVPTAVNQPIFGRAGDSACTEFVTSETCEGAKDGDDKEICDWAHGECVGNAYMPFSITITPADDSKLIMPEGAQSITLNQTPSGRNATVADGSASPWCYNVNAEGACSGGLPTSAFKMVVNNANPTPTGAEVELTGLIISAELESDTEEGWFRCLHLFAGQDANVDQATVDFLNEMKPHTIKTQLIVPSGINAKDLGETQAKGSALPQQSYQLLSGKVIYGEISIDWAE